MAGLTAKEAAFGQQYRAQKLARQKDLASYQMQEQLKKEAALQKQRQSAAQALTAQNHQQQMERNKNQFSRDVLSRMMGSGSGARGAGGISGGVSGGMGQQAQNSNDFSWIHKKGISPEQARKDVAFHGNMPMSVSPSQYRGFTMNAIDDNGKAETISATYAPQQSQQQAQDFGYGDKMNRMIGGLIQNANQRQGMADAAATRRELAGLRKAGFTAESARNFMNQGGSLERERQPADPYKQELLNLKKRGIKAKELEAGLNFMEQFKNENGKYEIKGTVLTPDQVLAKAGMYADFLKNGERNQNPSATQGSFDPGALNLKNPETNTTDQGPGMMNKALDIFNKFRQSNAGQVLPFLAPMPMSGVMGLPQSRLFQDKLKPASQYLGQKGTQAAKWLSQPYK